MIDPVLIRRFATGWARTRQVAPPIDEGEALRIEVGLPDEVRRFVILAPPVGIAEIGTSITQPAVLLKAPAAPKDVAALLRPGWHVEQTGTIMTVEALPTARPIVREGFKFTLDDLGGVAAVRVVTTDGAPAARGRLTVVDDWALHDRIHVEEPYRRRGLGRLVMQALGAEGARRGAHHGLLAATEMGRALYQTIGWQALGPWTTAQILP